MTGSYEARDEYTATGGQTEFAITFPFLDSSHVQVLQNEVEISTFTVTSSILVTLDSGATAGDSIVVRRRTPHTSLVAFTGGVPVTQENMETQRKQFTYIAEEQADDFAVPQVAARVSPVIRLLMTQTALPLDASTLLTNGSNTVQIDATKEAHGNTPSQFTFPGSGVQRPASGLWEVIVEGELVRTDTTAGAVDVEFDMVNTTDGNEPLEMQEDPIVMGVPLSTAPDDAITVPLRGRAFLDLSEAKSHRLQVARTAGAAAVTLQNCFVSWVRLGD